MDAHCANEDSLLLPLTSRQQLTQAVGRQLYLTRKSRGITGKGLGAKLGVSQQQISRYERGICHIDIDVLVCLLNELNMPLNDFFMSVSLILKETSPKTYEEFHSLFFSLVNYVPDGYSLMKKNQYLN
ncbi:TPA: helix-turn-helix domain-containing protein [Providencia rettgeri]